mmetsp:Transcript_83623/g.270281  ORF Transcript_83623/g.270281 Transcript_83623/m.270281 type:complete len:234 (+) Transcript_83623:180-881(+)
MSVCGSYISLSKVSSCSASGGPVAAALLNQALAASTEMSTPAPCRCCFANAIMQSPSPCSPPRRCQSEATSAAPLLSCNRPKARNAGPCPSVAARRYHSSGVDGGSAIDPEARSAADAATAAPPASSSRSAPSATMALGKPCEAALAYNRVASATLPAAAKRLARFIWPLASPNSALRRNHASALPPSAPKLAPTSSDALRSSNMSAKLFMAPGWPCNALFRYHSKAASEFKA